MASRRTWERQRRTWTGVPTPWVCLLAATSALCVGLAQGTGGQLDATGQPLPHRTGGNARSLQSGKGGSSQITESTSRSGSDNTRGTKMREAGNWAISARERSLVSIDRAVRAGSRTSTSAHTRQLQQQKVAGTRGGAHTARSQRQPHKKRPHKKRSRSRGVSKKRLGKRAAPRGAGWWSTRGRHFVDGSGNVVSGGFNVWLAPY